MNWINVSSKPFIIILLSLACWTNLLGQSFSSVDSLDQNLLNWYNKSPEDGVMGADIERAYTILKDKKPARKTVVAIIDSGVDTNHVDIKGQIWINEDEIPGNQIDDDQNGYVDDINGWNFLGNAKGENIFHETYEQVKIFNRFNEEFKGYAFKKDVPEDRLDDFRDYEKSRTFITSETEKYEKLVKLYKEFIQQVEKHERTLTRHFDRDNFTASDICAIRTDKLSVAKAAAFMCGRFKAGYSRREVQELYDYFKMKVEKNLNTSFNPRPKIIGDDINDINDNGYGNPDVGGPDPKHGTFIAGIIGGLRNEFGINGINRNVIMMPIRAVPKGDEQDKDVALAIRYAVDNGAHIINMSFGKDFSPNKLMVDSALKYAEENNVLVIHAAGNSAHDIDRTPHYPRKYCDNGDTIQNLIVVGASAKKEGRELCGAFSNYGSQYVDIFAPGVNILSLAPNNQYIVESGTSFAAPVVSGVAALVWSYYPQLSATELKQVLLNSNYDLKREKVYLPNITSEKKKKTRFKNICKTGGIINAYSAILAVEDLIK